MQTIRQWHAKRAGARITIYGKDIHSADVRVTKVREIRGAGYAGPETGHVAMPIATDDHGNQWALV